MLNKIFLQRQKGFSLVELFIAMIIIAIFSSFITANITSQSQTAKQEAEKLAAYLTDLARKSDRRHMNLTIKFENSNVTAYFGTNSSNAATSYDIPSGFSISQNFPNNKLAYDSNENEFNNYGTITITKALNKTYHYIVIGNVGKGGRIRTTETEP